MITKIIQDRKMSFFDKINNYLIVNSIKEILKGRDETLKNRCWIVLTVITHFNNVDKF